MPCDQLLTDVVTSLRPLAERKGLALELDLAQEKLRARTDRRAFRQILLNLVNNAIAFTQHGRGARHARPRRRRHAARFRCA